MKLEQINKSYVVRALASFSFIIFFCPFLQTCSNESIKELHKNDISTINIKKDTINNEIIENNEELINYYNSDLFKNSKKEYTYNFYKMAYFPIEEFHIKDLIDYEFYIYLIVSIIILLSIIILYFSFKNDFIKIKKLNIISLVLLHFYLILMTFNLVVDNIDQIKYGYYLFLINSLLIIYFSNKLLKEEKE